MENVAEETVRRDLKWWRGGDRAQYLEQPSCGSPACFGGWLPFIPEFKAQGVTASPITGCPVLEGARWENVDLHLFGVGDLFAPQSTIDEAVGLAGKALILHRLDTALANATLEA